MAEKNLEVSVLLDHYGALLTEKQQQMIDLYYNDDLSLSEIAEQEGISRQGVRDNIKRAEAQLLSMEQALGFAGRFKRMIELFAHAEEVLSETEGELVGLRKTVAAKKIHTLREELAAFTEEEFE